MSRKVHRRNFLGKTAIAGAAVGLAKVYGADSANRQVVVGVMGLGRGRALAEGFAHQPRCTVKYVCDVDERRSGEVTHWAVWESPTAYQRFSSHPG